MTEKSGLNCEACGADINKGDKYQPGFDGQCFCETHAATYQDGVDHYAEFPPDDDEQRAAAEGCRTALADHIAAGGSPGDIPLIVME